MTVTSIRDERYSQETISERLVAAGLSVLRFTEKLSIPRTERSSIRSFCSEARTSVWTDWKPENGFRGKHDRHQYETYSKTVGERSYEVGYTQTRCSTRYWMRISSPTGVVFRARSAIAEKLFRDIRQLECRALKL